MSTHWFRNTNHIRIEDLTFISKNHQQYRIIKYKKSLYITVNMVLIHKKYEESTIVGATGFLGIVRKTYN